MKKNILYLGIIILIVMIAMSSGGNDNSEKKGVKIENSSSQEQAFQKQEQSEIEKKDEDKKEILKNNNIENTYNEMLDRLPDHFMVCIPTETVVCEKSKCENTDPKIFNLLSGRRRDNTISRCDSNGCDTYSSTYETTGIFEIIQPIEPRGFFLKRQALSLDEGQANNYLPYTEIVSLFLKTQISSGYCIDIKYNQ